MDSQGIPELEMLTLAVKLVAPTVELQTKQSTLTLYRSLIPGLMDSRYDIANANYGSLRHLQTTIAHAFANRHPIEAPVGVVVGVPSELKWKDPYCLVCSSTVGAANFALPEYRFALRIH